MAGCSRTTELQKLLLQLAGLLLLLNVGIGHGGGLSYDYYANSCPELETIVHKAILPFFTADPRSPAALLRLLFHDCQVQACDASILLDSDDSRSITSEMVASKNFGIRNRESIGMLKAVVDSVCPGTVSCADVLALAAREAVACTGGPYIAVPLGRKDAISTSNLLADQFLPSSSSGVDEALRIFKSKGMSVEEAVAILGSHTLGSGHCINIVNRLYYAQKNSEENLDSLYEEFLRLKCPTPEPVTNITIVFNDLTPVIFDNHYFRDIMQGRGLFTVDSATSVDSKTVSYVKLFAKNQDYFFRVFSSAFVKLSSAAVLTGGNGEIRRQCNRVN